MYIIFNNLSHLNNIFYKFIICMLHRVLFALHNALCGLGWSTCLHCTAQHHCSASTSSSYLPPTCYRWGGAAQRHHQPPSCHHPGHNNSSMPGSTYSQDTVGEEKKQAQKTSITLFYAVVSSFAAAVLWLLSFSSPYWLASWEDTRTDQRFLNMGLWTFCFDRCLDIRYYRYHRY